VGGEIRISLWNERVEYRKHERVRGGGREEEGKGGVDGRFNGE
jgi:hypothetical protein